jgi:hypothetical protein
MQISRDSTTDILFELKTKTWRSTMKSYITFTTRYPALLERKVEKDENSKYSHTQKKTFRPYKYALDQIS